MSTLRTQKVTPLDGETNLILGDSGDTITIPAGVTLAGSGASLTNLPSSPNITQGTAVASTSGTAISYTGIPAGTKRILLSFATVSTSGSSQAIVQLGDSGGFETSGYDGCISNISNGGSPTNKDFTDGFALNNGWAAFVSTNGTLVLSLLDSSTYTWACTGTLGRDDNTNVNTLGGTKSLSAELTQIRVTTSGGSDTFDAGKINIQYEG